MSNCDYQPQGSEGPTTDTTHALMRSSASWTVCQGQTCVYRISASARILSTSTRPESGSASGDRVPEVHRFMVDCMADEIFEHPARLTARIADYEGPWDKSVSVDMRVWWDIRGLWLGDYVRVVLAVAD